MNINRAFSTRKLIIALMIPLNLRSILLFEVISCIIEVVVGRKKEQSLPGSDSPANRIERYSVMLKACSGPTA